MIAQGLTRYRSLQSIHYLVRSYVLNVHVFFQACIVMSEVFYNIRSAQFQKSF